MHSVILKAYMKKQKKGEIKEFTGISAPYEEPDNADVIVDTTNQTVDESVQEVLEYVEKHLVQPVENMRSTTDGGSI